MLVYVEGVCGEEVVGVLCVCGDSSGLGWNVKGCGGRGGGGEDGGVRVWVGVGVSKRTSREENVRCAFVYVSRGGKGGISCA